MIEHRYFSTRGLEYNNLYFDVQAELIRPIRNNWD